MAYEIDFIGVGDDTKRMRMQLLFDGRIKTIIIKLLFTMGDFKLMGIRWLNI